MISFVTPYIFTDADDGEILTQSPYVQMKIEDIKEGGVFECAGSYYQITTIVDAKKNQNIAHDVYVREIGQE